jgi:hypothetical protein
MRQCLLADADTAAAEAWKQAHAEGRVLASGETRRRPSSRTLREGLITEPHSHFGKLFGVGEKYVEMAWELVQFNAVAAAAVRAGWRPR